MILFFTLDLGRNGSDQKKSEAVYAYFFKHLSLSMLIISFMLIKKRVFLLRFFKKLLMFVKEKYFKAVVNL